jgi:hypothetical protein
MLSYQTFEILKRKIINSTCHKIRVDDIFVISNSMNQYVYYYGTPGNLQFVLLVSPIQ